MEITKKIIIFCCVCILFVGCASTSGSIQTDIINGATETDTAIQQQSGATSEIGIDSQAIADSSSAIAITSSDIAREVSELAEQLRFAGDEEREYAEIIQRVQNRQPVDYIESIATDKQTGVANTKVKDNP